MLQHISDREHLIKCRPDVLTAIAQGPHHTCDSNIEHYNGLNANICKQMGTGKSGSKESDPRDYIIASTSSPGLIELDHELTSLFLGATVTQRKSERVTTHERIKGDYFKAVRAVMLEFLKSLIRSACSGDLDKTWPPINPFDTGKEAAARELATWEANQDKSVKNMFKCMLQRREAELENQKRTKADAIAILQKSNTRVVPGGGSALGTNQAIHSEAIRQMGKDIVDLKFKDDDDDDDAVIYMGKRTGSNQDIIHELGAAYGAGAEMER